MDASVVVNWYFVVNAIITVISLSICLWRFRQEADLKAVAMGVPISLAFGIPVVGYVLISELRKKTS